MGFLIDVAALAVICAFGWAGYTLGLVRSAIRLLAALGAVGLAVLLRGPAAALLTKLTPASEDFASLLGMLVVGAGCYLAVATIVTYYAGWVPHERLRDADRALGAIPGVVLGTFWCGFMVSLLVLTPADGFLARGAIRSATGGVMISGAPGVLRWLNRTFPHYTQTLPKGDRGAVTRPVKGTLPLRDVTVEEDPDQAGELLANINQYRNAKDRAELVWNNDVADAATQHSTAMATDAFLAYATPGGNQFEERMKGKLGSNVVDYDTFGEQVVWAHGAANAYAALINDRKARELLLDEKITEIGIGVVEAGWFNGRFFTIGVIGRRPITTVPGGATGTGSSTGTAPAGQDQPGAPAGTLPGDDAVSGA